MFRSFHQRVLFLVVGLVVLAQVTTFAALLSTLDKDVKADMRKKLDAGAVLVTQLIEKRSDLLLNSAEVLAADFGFKSAVASHDKQTILSALRNNLIRIDADLVSLIALDGSLISSTYSVNEDAQIYEKLAQDAQTQGVYSTSVVIADKARQIVVVPIKAPLNIGWLLLGFSLDDALAQEL